MGNIRRYSATCAGHDFAQNGRLLAVSGIEDSLVTRDRNSYHAVWFTPSSKSFAPVDSNLTVQRWYPSVRIRPGDPQANSNAWKFYAWDGIQDSSEDVPTCYVTLAPEQYPDRLDGNDWTGLTDAGSACHPVLNSYAPVTYVPDSTWSGTGGGGWLAVSQVDYPASQTPDTWITNPETCDTTFFSDAPRSHRNGTDVLGPFELNADGTYKAGPNLYLIGGYTATVDTIPGCGSHAPHGDVSYFSASSKSWSSKASMSIPRQNHTAVLLADNTILAMGGSKMLDCCQHDPTSGGCPTNYERPAGGDSARECITRIPELYDIDANSWRQLALHSLPRTYHSAALLLPDGRVYLGGGEYVKGDIPEYKTCPTSTVHMLSIEVFKPPYMFRTSRPTIALLGADSVAYNTQVSLKVTGWEVNDSKVMLIRQGSGTHGHEMAARTVHLRVLQDSLLSGSTYRITARIPLGKHRPPPPGLVHALGRHELVRVRQPEAVPAGPLGAALRRRWRLRPTRRGWPREVHAARNSRSPGAPLRRRAERRRHRSPRHCFGARGRRHPRALRRHRPTRADLDRGSAGRRKPPPVGWHRRWRPADAHRRLPPPRDRHGRRDAPAEGGVGAIGA